MIRIKPSSYPVIQIKDNEDNNWEPEAFIKIIGKTHLNKMIQDNHLKMLINGKEYWIPFIEKINKKGEI